MKKWKIILMMALVACITSPAWAGPKVLSVQVKEGQLKDKPSFLGKSVADVAYGDRVTLADKQGAWLQVSNEAGVTGWIHESALTKKRVVLQAGDEDVDTGASGEELALAGKGFNSDVEAEFKANNTDIDFTWIDRMEKIDFSAGERKRFLKEGGVSASTGGGQ